LAVTLYFMGDFESAAQYAARGARIWRSASVEVIYPGDADSAVSCLAFDALSKWHLGESFLAKRRWRKPFR
jgi:hypothetical protein